MNALPTDLLRKIVKYDKETQQLLWAERDGTCYPNAKTPEVAAIRAATFNKTHAGKPVTVRENASGIRYVNLRFINSTANIGFDRLLWLAISGDLTEHVLYYEDGNLDNLALDNISLTHKLTKQTLQQPTTGITAYTVSDETKYRASVSRNKDAPRCIKSGFDTAESAYQWRVGYLKQHRAFWRIKASTAYENNQYK